MRFNLKTKNLLIFYTVAIIKIFGIFNLLYYFTMSCENIFSRPPDLEFYLPLSTVKNTTIYDDADIKEVVTRAPIYASPSCLEAEYIGEYRVSKTFDDNLRIAYFTIFFNYKKTGINGTLTSFFPTDAFDGSGVLTNDKLGRITQGSGDFIFSNGYDLTTTATKEKPYFHTRIWLTSNTCN
jgi:hypothetical protein